MPESIDLGLIASFLGLALCLIQAAAEHRVAIGVVLAMLGRCGEALELLRLDVFAFELFEKPALRIACRRLHLARPRTQAKPVDRDCRMLVHRSPPSQLFVTPAEPPKDST